MRILPRHPRKFYPLAVLCIIVCCRYPLWAAGEKNNGRRLYTVAEGAYRDGLYDFSIGQLEQFLSLYPQSRLAGPARLMLAESLYQKKSFSRAVTHYRKLLNFPKSDRNKINYRLGECYYRIGKFSQAAEAFSGIEQNEKTQKFYPRTLYLRADSLLKVKKYGQAGKIYQNFLDKFPKHPYYKSALFGLGWSQFQKGRFADSLESLESFVKEYPPINQRAQARFLIALTLEKLNKYTKAIAAYEEFLSDYPDDPRLDEIRLRQGLVYFKTRFYGRAATILEKYVLAHPENADPYLYQIGISHTRLKHYKRAQKYFTKLINDYSGSPYIKEARYHLGYCYLKQNKKSSALELFQKTAKGATETARISSFQMGILQAEKKNYQAAQAAFQKAVSSHDRVLAAEAQYRLADTIQKSQKPKQALIHFRKVIKNFPRQKNWVELARIKVAENLATQGDFQGAEKNLRGLSKYRKAASHLLKEIQQQKKKKTPPQKKSAKTSR